MNLLNQEIVAKEYQNFKFQQPYQQALYYCSLILQDHTWPWKEELEVLHHLEANYLAKFAPLLLSRVFLECYIAGYTLHWITVEDIYVQVSSVIPYSHIINYHCYITIVGNYEPNEAESMIQYVEDIFFKGLKPICQPLFPSQHLTNRVVKLENSKSYFYSTEGLNPSDENSCLVHYIQVIT